MTDKEFEKLIRKAHKLARDHKSMVEAAEIEYKRRFGHHPSDIDDDWWIDALHYGYGNPDLARIVEHAKEAVERYES